MVVKPFQNTIGNVVEKTNKLLTIKSQTITSLVFHNLHNDYNVTFDNDVMSHQMK